MTDSSAFYVEEGGGSLFSFLFVAATTTVAGGRGWRKRGANAVITADWEAEEVDEVSSRVTRVWWVYGGHRPSGPPAPVQTAAAGTAVPSWRGPRPPRYRYHRPNG